MTKGEIKQDVLFVNPLTTGLKTVLIGGLETLTHYVVPYQSDYDHPNKLKNLVAESWNAAVLDRGASKTVCGQ